MTRLSPQLSLIPNLTASLKDTKDHIPLSHLSFLHHVRLVQYVNWLLGLQNFSISVADGHEIGLPLMPGLCASFLTGRCPHCRSSPCPGNESTSHESVPAIHMASFVSISCCGYTFTSPDSHCADLFCCLGWKSQCLTMQHS